MLTMPERKLLEQVSDVARFRHLSLRTEQAYPTWIKRYILFHHKQHPKNPCDPKRRKVAALESNHSLSLLINRTILDLSPLRFLFHDEDCHEIRNHLNSSVLPPRALDRGIRTGERSRFTGPENHRQQRQ